MARRSQKASPVDSDLYTESLCIILYLSTCQLGYYPLRFRGLYWNSGSGKCVPIFSGVLVVHCLNSEFVGSWSWTDFLSAVIVYHYISVSVGFYICFFIYSLGINHRLPSLLVCHLKLVF